MAHSDRKEAGKKRVTCLLLRAKSGRLGVEESYESDFSWMARFRGWESNHLINVIQWDVVVVFFVRNEWINKYLVRMNDSSSVEGSFFSSSCSVAEEQNALAFWHAGLWRYGLRTTLLPSGTRPSKRKTSAEQTERRAQLFPLCFCVCDAWCEMRGNKKTLLVHIFTLSLYRFSKLN